MTMCHNVKGLLNIMKAELNLCTNKWGAYTMKVVLQFYQFKTAIEVLSRFKVLTLNVHLHVNTYIMLSPPSAS